MTKLINRPDIKQRILWFSDIHFLDDVVEEYLQIFLNSFIETCAQINNEKAFNDDTKNINYVIISGDLTNKGTKKEFKKFEKYILKPLFKVLENSKLLVVPGNHDVDIEANFDYKDILDFNEKENRHKKNDFIHYNENYRSFFINYSQFCKDNISYFPDNLNDSYAQDFLYGYCKDEESKLLFILLNSAWLSLSVKLLEYFLNKEYINPIDLETEKINKSYEEIYSQLQRIKSIMKSEKEDFNKDNLNQLENNISILNTLLKDARKEQKNRKNKLTGNAYNISYQTVEYGIQELFLNFLFENVESLCNFTNKHKDYFIITVMHHPENHLTWGERLEPSSLFSYLKKYSDIVLSSHEHVPIGFRQDQNRNNKQNHNINNPLHLKSGPFIELEFNNTKERPNTNQFDYYKEDYLKKSTFSILDINISKKKVTENRYGYNIKCKNWEHVNNSIDSYSLVKNPIKLCYSDIQRVYLKLKSTNSENIIKKIVNNEVKEISGVSEMYFMEDELYIIHNYLEFIQGDNLDVFKKIIIENKIKKIFFYSIDIMIDYPIEDEFDRNKLNSFYLKDIEDDRNISLGKLKKKMFKNFNSYRSLFFNSLTSLELENFSDISFILILLPYWEIERVI